MIATAITFAVLTLSADFTAPNGEIRRDLHCSGFGPQICSCPWEYIENLKSFGMKASRTHDWALINPNERVCDNHMVFPLDHLDPKDPKSYYFKATDFLLKRTIQECGHEVFYRLGTSIEHAYYGGRFNINIPKDFDRVAENFAATVRHYNRGWAEGFNWNIKYWEIWNEPDGVGNMWWLPDDDPRFTNKPANMKDQKAVEAAREKRCRELFVEFYVTCLKRLKSEFGDSIKVGGPAMCGWKGDYFKDILTACKQAGVAPDFISWHHYMEDSDCAVNAIRQARELCDSFGFTKCELIINEWHYFSFSDYDWNILRSPKPEAIRKCWTGPRSHNGIDSSAFFLSTVSRFHDTALTQSYYYGCSNIGSWGYMDSLKQKYKIFYALQLMGKFMKTYKNRFVAKGVDPKGPSIATILAAKSADGKKSALLIADYRVRTKEITVDVKGIPADAKVKATVLDYTQDLASAQVIFKDGKLTIPKTDEESAAYLVEFE